MAIYFDQRVDPPHPGSVPLHSQFHSTLPLLAVSFYSNSGGGSIYIVNDEGEAVKREHDTKNEKPAALAWHPNKNILAFAWESGSFSIRSETGIQNYDKHHNCAIHCMIWNSNGNRLLTADMSGHVFVWKVDPRGTQIEVATEQTMNESPRCALFRTPSTSDPLSEISLLARAAVSGDESALEMFSWKKGKTDTSKMPYNKPETVAFLLGGDNGGVYYVSDDGKMNKCFAADSPIKKMLFNTDKQIVTTIQESLMITQHTVSSDGTAKSLSNVKLSAKDSRSDFCWAGKGVLACATGEKSIRIWDMDQDENYVLRVEEHPSFTASEVFTCICYSDSKGLLFAGTLLGKVAIWKLSASSLPGAEPESRWHLQQPIQLQSAIMAVQVGTNRQLLSAVTETDAFILTEHAMSSHCNAEITCVQTGPYNIVVDQFAAGIPIQLNTKEIQVRGVHVTKELVVVWNGKHVVVYEFGLDRITVSQTGAFNCNTSLVAAFEKNLYTLESHKIEVRTVQGTVKQTLKFTEKEGCPVHMNICGSYLVAASNEGFFKVFNVALREAKLMNSDARSFREVSNDFGSLTHISCNCNGTKVAASLVRGNGAADPRLYIWDMETNSVGYFDFKTGKNDVEDTTPAERSGSGKTRDQASRREVNNLFPTVHFWDAREPRLIACEAERLPPEKSRDQFMRSKIMSPATEATDLQAKVLIVSLFTTQEMGNMVQDSFPRSRAFASFIGIQVPYHYFVKKTGVEAETSVGETQNMFTPRAPDPESFVSKDTSPVYVPEYAARRTMRDFIGLENANEQSTAAMINFSYYLTVDNMDEAFKSIKLIKSETVWENMAKMCVKSRRLDVARVCLGNMGHARAAKALREAQNEPEKDAQAAILAMQLGLNEEAEQLLLTCQRYDLLNELYQCTNQWDKAKQVSEKHDRVNLRTTYFNYAKHLEANGDIDKALGMFKLSETHRFEVPRMLFDDRDALEQYVHSSDDPVLKKWWAQYMESTGDLDEAIKYYEMARDYVSLVRLHCFAERVSEAARICENVGDHAACYQLAKHYENQAKYREAIKFFERAGAMGNAIRLCKEQNMEELISGYALRGSAEDKLEAARHYEAIDGMQDRAVMLYHEAGHSTKAIQLALRTGQFGALQYISEKLDPNTDPQMLRQLADLFMEHGQYDKAVDLLALTKQYDQAIQLLYQHNTQLTEDLAEKLTPSKEDTSVDRVRTLELLADACMHQGQYHIATKKYTEAGNKLKAMKALLKSGDTEKVIFFAGVSRQKEIYIMAANYLQTMDWKKDPEIMKHIISFYTKGKAIDSLAGFYEACADVEVDEYQNYEKALGALNEALKCLSKGRGVETRADDIQVKINQMRKFVQAKRVYDENAEEAIKQCQALLDEPEIDNAVRIGDIIGFLVDHFAKRQKWKAAYGCIEMMKARMPKANLTFFIDPKLLEAIYREMNIKPDFDVRASKAQNGHIENGHDEEEIYEEVDD